MGKGQRIRAGRAAEKEAQKIAAAKKAKKAKTTKIATSIIAAVLLVCLVGGVLYHTIYTSAYSKGNIQRDTIVMESDNYKIDAAMMSYYFYTQYNSFANNYSTYLSSLGLDTSKSLKRQDCTLQSGSTWFEYFCDMAGSQVKEYLYLAENAIKAGMSLDEADKKSVQGIIDEYYEYAKENKVDNETFLSAVFGTGVKEADVRKCLELSTLADKYHESYMSTLKYSDEEIDKYYKDNIDKYRFVDYYSYSIAATDSKDKNTYPAAEKKAKELAAVKTTDAFKAWVEKDFRAENPITEDNKKEELESDLKSILDELESKQITYSKDDKASEWLFKTAKVGETYIEDSGSGTYTVYYSTATPYRDETATRTIRDIVLTEENHDKDEIKADAEDIVNQMKKMGLTAETFEKIAEEHSENTATSANGGLCENWKKSSYDGKIGDWVFDAKRKTGDFEAFPIDGGYAICYYVGEGIPAWKSDCINAKKSDDYSAAYEKWTKDFALTENEKGYRKIPDNLK